MNKGFAVINFDSIMVNSVAETKNGAAMKALWKIGYAPEKICRVPECDCIAVLMTKRFPHMRLVTVTIQVAQ